MTKEINKRFMLPLNLQHFADGGAEENKNNGGADGEQEIKKETKEQEQQQTTFTQADMDRMISKMYEQFEAKFTKKQEEAVKLANMNAEEKAKYQLEQQQKQLEDMQRNFTMQQNKSECMKILAERNIDVTLADFVVAEDAETMKANIDKIEKAFKKSVEEEVNRRLKSTTPKKDVTLPSGEITKEVFKKMTLNQQQELYNTNKELYMQLIK
ncbi:DUF4355 domain-containing protein [Sedimentibacter hydroxybenzoicus DSM 7310]|uniref:DUF4355 domain-containing protein n=1 Tax=Sedimentibacter hydroxybenzoicus DSM 7310 TaxID=1123245 RepID=A0A974GVJ5_SEDHY|nr:DUF4355 domain-containing protein [Sedimentibacter hydroxybenzoicus]NYB73401.1 DUF4355 domain-containing protein [Sedimentibacter hydroxybenzoicus DSM 7310]